MVRFDGLRFQHVRSLVLAFLGVITSLWLASPALAVAPEFTKPEAIAPNVAFWKRVYAVWNVDDIVFHDKDDLSLVYRVIHAPPRGGKDAQGRTRKQVVAAAQAETAAALRALHKKNPKSDAGLVGVERDIFTALHALERSDKFAHADGLRAQNGMLERFLDGYRKSGRYERFIHQEMQRNGLPKELIGIAFVESLFHTGARSKVGAAGIWQFMSYTGREYMHLNDVVDERWDPMIATESAARYLKQAKKELGTWPLAITSYNYGRGGMRELARNAGSEDFGKILAVTKAKRFGFAARNYYASFLAVLELLEEAGDRFTGVEKHDPWQYDVVLAPFALYARQVVATGLVDAGTLDGLNPALTQASLGNKVALPEGLPFRVPLGSGAAVWAALQALPETEKQQAARASHTVHIANGKQSLAAIARRYQLDVDVVAKRNGLPGKAVPRKGAKLSIPVAKAGFTLLPEVRNLPTRSADGAEVLVASSDGGDVEGDARTAIGELTAASLARLNAQTKGAARITRVETLRADVGGVDVVAGANQPHVDAQLNDVDAVAGVVPRGRRRPPLDPRLLVSLE
jgi:membrane-bound lytic murein transglycosylase D